MFVDSTSTSVEHSILSTSGDKSKGLATTAKKSDTSYYLILLNIHSYYSSSVASALKIAKYYSVGKYFNIIITNNIIIINK